MYFLIWLMILHFIADFILQSREMGKKKSNEVKWLLKHMGIQWSVFFIGVAPFQLFRYLDIAANNPLAAQYPLTLFVAAACMRAFVFSSCNTLIHGLIDWNIWKLYKLSAHHRILKQVYQDMGYGLDTNDIKQWTKQQYDIGVKNWQYWEDHWFYTTIGFDQLLHSITIIVLAWWCLL